MRRILYALLFFIPFQLTAQIVCTGNACGKIAQYNPLVQSFLKTYTPRFLEDSIYAGSITSVAPIPRWIQLDSATVGIGFRAGMTQKNSVIVTDPVTSKNYYVPESGLAIAPLAFAGANAGWIFNGIYNTYLDWFKCDLNKCHNDRKIALLSDFDIYGYGSKVYGFSMSGGEIVYHAMDADDWFRFLKFTGLSVGVGYTYLDNRLSFSVNENAILNRTILSQSISWTGRNQFFYESREHTVYAEARAGIKLFFLSLYGGAGDAETAGYSTFGLTSEGNVQFLQENAQYGLNMMDNRQSAFHNPFLLAGASIGGLTIHGTCSTRRDRLTGHKACSAEIGMSVEF